MPTDAELLQRYVRDKAEDAFTEFVRRNVGLVYSAAFRRTGGRAHLAEEIAQKVFSDLSHKAAALSRHPALAGWLYQSTRYAAIDAVRAEMRRANLAHSLSAMDDEASLPEPAPDWDKLRPVLDEAMDELKDPDRELMLLRFFQGLSFSEVGAKLHLSENAARKRTERALDKLRAQLGKRGVTSTAAALTLLLTHHSLAAAPASVVASVTTVVWSATHQDLKPEIAALRLENTRLEKSTGPEAQASSLAAVSDDYSRRATAITQALVQQQAARTQTAAQSAQGASPSGPALSAHGYSNCGQATAADAVITFAWASDVCDPDEFAKLVYFDPATREHAMKVLATMPESIRTSCPTPETFYGLLLAASCLEAPPPSALLAKRMMTLVEIAPGRVGVRRVGMSYNFHEYQQTPEGWKWVFPEAGIEGAPQILNSETLAKLNPHP